MTQARITSRVPESEIDKAAAELGLTAVENAYYDQAGELVLVAGGEAFTVRAATPLPAAGRTDTLPQRGPSQPAWLGEAEPPTEGPVPPPGPGPSPQPEAAVSQAEPRSADDFTAINGVGPVTAAKLNDAGLYTYDDLRTPGLDQAVGERTAAKIRAWLQARQEQS